MPLTAATRSAASFAVRFATLATRAIPELRAEALGLFRIFFAASLFVAVKDARLELVAGYVPDDGQLGWGWVGWLASRPDLVVLLENTIFSLLVLFAIGLFTRIVYPLVAAGVVVWTLVWIESQHSNAHMWLVTILTVICLIPVRWDAAFGLDETLRRWRGRGYGTGLRGKSYGFAVWIPGLVLGSVWASAAYAKMETSGIGWVLSGAVKYHWVIDAHDATVDWGLWVARHHWAAVLLSFCGVFFEAVFVFAAFAKSVLWRMGCAAAGFGLLAGFYLFHGLLWWPWLLVYVSFVIPWAALYAFLESRLSARTVAVDTSTPSGLRTARFWHGLDWFNTLRFVDTPHGDAPVSLVSSPSMVGGGLRLSHWLLVAAVSGHAMVELPAGFGRFGSYSNTYGSTDEFDQSSAIKWVDRLWVRHGTSDALEVEADVAVDAILRLSRGEALPSRYVDQLRADEAVDRAIRDGHRHLTLTRERSTFDWKRGRFNPPGPPLVAGTLDLESMTLAADSNDELK